MKTVFSTRSSACVLESDKTRRLYRWVVNATRGRNGKLVKDLARRVPPPVRLLPPSASWRLDGDKHRRVLCLRELAPVRTICAARESLSVTATAAVIVLLFQETG